jgi:hypothetical protein
LEVQQNNFRASLLIRKTFKRSFEKQQIKPFQGKEMIDFFIKKIIIELNKTLFNYICEEKTVLFSLLSSPFTLPSAHLSSSQRGWNWRKTKARVGVFLSIGTEVNS